MRSNNHSPSSDKIKDEFYDEDSISISSRVTSSCTGVLVSLLFKVGGFFVSDATKQSAQISNEEKQDINDLLSALLDNSDLSRNTVQNSAKESLVPAEEKESKEQMISGFHP